MYQGRYEKKMPAAKKPARRRKLNKYFLVTLSLVLLLGVAGGSTLAYIIAKGGTVENSFTPGEVLCSVDDTYSVTNDGNVDAYIRAAVVINWVNSAGDISGVAPVQQITDAQGNEVTPGDYKLTLGDGWEKIGEYYYYKAVVPFEGTSEKTTPVVIVEQLENAPEDFALVVEVIAEAIQAEGMGAASAQDAWALVMPANG